MTWETGVAAVLGALAAVYGIVVTWRFHASALALERARATLREAGERYRALADELDDERTRWRRQVSILEGDIAELEDYISTQCGDDGFVDRARFFASVQSLRTRVRDFAARDATVRGDAPAEVEPGGHEAVESALPAIVSSAAPPARKVGPANLGELWPFDGGKDE